MTINKPIPEQADDFANGTALTMRFHGEIHLADGQVCSSVTHAIRQTFLAGAAAAGEGFLPQLQALSKSRAARWHVDQRTGQPAEPWSLLEWSGAMCGESGEAANKAKKIKRLDQGLINPNHSEYTRERLVDECALEVADTILYGLCLLNEIGVDAESLLRTVFNLKSAEAGFPERI